MSGWTAALEGNADPSASYLLGFAMLAHQHHETPAASFRPPALTVLLHMKTAAHQNATRLAAPHVVVPASGTLKPTLVAPSLGLPAPLRTEFGHLFSPEGQDLHKWRVEIVRGHPRRAEQPYVPTLTCPGEVRKQHFSSPRVSGSAKLTPFEVNIRSMQAMQSIEKGSTALTGFWANINISHRAMHHKTFNGHLDKMLQAPLTAAAASESESAAVVKELYKGFMNPPGNIDVIFDGS
ncbi:hypothetical protein HPB47_018493 [Ixodes persulcatus]|uniref:Uncharacterized protein n=1 Tax=Ixodes persulcatus TaxID=34615 RepID=A0AC60QLF1_IXOPE|nr:hypothetical protein HPB47_018493 [Ixodes persulcatus]